MALDSKDELSSFDVLLYFMLQLHVRMCLCAVRPRRSGAPVHVKQRTIWDVH